MREVCRAVECGETAVNCTSPYTSAPVHARGLAEPNSNQQVPGLE